MGQVKAARRCRTPCTAPGSTTVRRQLPRTIPSSTPWVERGARSVPASVGEELTAPPGSYRSLRGIRLTHQAVPRQLPGNPAAAIRTVRCSAFGYDLAPYAVSLPACGHAWPLCERHHHLNPPPHPAGPQPSQAPLRGPATVTPHRSARDLRMARCSPRQIPARSTSQPPGQTPLHAAATPGRTRRSDWRCGDAPQEVMPRPVTPSRGVVQLIPNRRARISQPSVATSTFESSSLRIPGDPDADWAKAAKPDH